MKKILCKMCIRMFEWCFAHKKWGISCFHRIVHTFGYNMNNKGVDFILLLILVVTSRGRSRAILKSTLRKKGRTYLWKKFEICQDFRRLCHSAGQNFLKIFFPFNQLYFNLCSYQKSDTSLQYLYAKMGVVPPVHFHNMAFNRPVTTIFRECYWKTVYW